MAVQGALGTVMAISDTSITTNIDTEAEFFAVTGYTDVSLIENFGEFGKQFDLVTFQAVADGRTYKLKGGYNAGSMQVVIGQDLADAGQDKLYDNANSATQARIAVRLILNDEPSSLGGASRYYFLAMPMSWRTNLGAVNNAIRATVNMEIDSEIIYVPPALLYNTFATGESVAGWDTFKGTDPQATLPVLSGGNWSFVSGDAGTGFAADGVEAVGATSMAVQLTNGRVVVDGRLSISSTATAAFFIGLTDNNASLEMPIEMPSGSLVTNATDAVGILFDTGAGDTQLRAVGVNNNVDETSQTLGALADTSMHSYRIDVDASGNATFFFDGAQVGTAMTTALQTGVNLFPVLAVVTRTTASRTLAVDQAYMRQE